MVLDFYAQIPEFWGLITTNHLCDRANDTTTPKLSRTSTTRITIRRTAGLLKRQRRTPEFSRTSPRDGLGLLFELSDTGCGVLVFHKSELVTAVIGEKLV
ncbi:hypothetical protein [Acaryochloris sp. CCMEE 5410]|uniref:hypothetical protein n=1 Tax=Acaryochloris sp. CCMEE 5410 TaxID=310037 RepID=UPI0002E4FB5E|nr:hypothetical protein [Acaryochloris sp. CCMEE 5410]KAI9129624.1 hypothetical protein ON05_033550 [Acaryochloris sp. CCMEE 5410]